MSAAEQRESFESALRDALADACDLNVAQAVHEQLSARIAEHKENHIPEPLVMTAKDIGVILRDCRVPEERIEAFQKNCSEAFGEGVALSPANLIDPGRFVVQTEQATVTVDPEHSFEVETRIIDGKPYLLIPAGTDVEVNGMPVKVSGGA